MSHPRKLVFARRITVMAMSTGMLFLSVSCGESKDRTDGSGSPSSESSTPSRTPENGPSFQLPISHYSFTTEESALLSKAEGIATRQCMARFDLTYAPAHPRLASGSDRRYGITSREEAKELGYHQPSSSAQTNAALPKRDLLVLMGSLHPEQDSPDTQTVEVDGKQVPVPAGGCTGDAARSVRGPSTESKGAATAQNIALTGFKESLADAKVASVLKNWAKCMKEKGFTYSSPLEPANDFAGKPTASAEEKRLALADISCKERTDLVRVWVGVESAIQKAKIAAHMKDLTDLKHIHASQMKTARSIIAKSGG
ncbi:hypothetical protein ACGFZA_31040 [Streptomyces sp. NPDC048211]|uniref:hypothetical protein n=1 Tax=Streptomyces sp. NPDC048211 TaxID=3365516 RepID=UPI0037183B95